MIWNVMVDEDRAGGLVQMDGFVDNRLAVTHVFNDLDDMELICYHAALVFESMMMNERERDEAKH